VGGHDDRHTYEVGKVADAVLGKVVEITEGTRAGEMSLIPTVVVKCENGHVDADRSQFIVTTHDLPF
jgi:hypothetical protein